MLSDLDTLLAARGIDAVLVPMHEAMHPSFRWLTRGAKVTRGYAVKLRGREPILVVSPWFEARRQEYQDGLLNLSRTGDWDAWVLFFATGVESSADTTRTRRYWTK